MLWRQRTLVGVLPEYTPSRNVRALCPECVAVTTYEWRDATNGREFGYIEAPFDHEYDENTCRYINFVFYRCAGCGRAGMSKLHSQGDRTSSDAVMEWFVPTVTQKASLPEETPEAIRSEFREAETCADAGAWRAASAMLRSVLEKVLKINGYEKGSLYDKIDAAAADGVITEARKKRAHDEIRSLGNDVLHDEWRPVSPEEFELAHQYAQRVIEDLYDDRVTVEALLVEKKRLPEP